MGLNGLSTDADMTLESAGGEVIGESANGGADPELIEQYLAPGAYRVRIKLYADAGTPFRLEIIRP